MKVINDSTTRKYMMLSIKLGNPRYKCARYGICEINPDDDGSFYGNSTSLMDKRVRATVFATQQQQLIFLFDRNSLTAKTDKTHFADGFFIMEAPKTLPLFVSNQLGIRPCQIATGIYPIVSNNGFYKIVMSIESISQLKQLDCGCSKQHVNTRLEAF